MPSHRKKISANTDKSVLTNKSVLADSSLAPIFADETRRTDFLGPVSPIFKNVIDDKIGATDGKIGDRENKIGARETKIGASGPKKSVLEKTKSVLDDL